MQWWSRRIEFSGGRNRGRGRHNRRSQRAVSDYGRLHQTHAARPGSYGERVSQAWIKTAHGGASRAVPRIMICRASVSDADLSPGVSQKRPTIVWNPAAAAKHATPASTNWNSPETQSQFLFL